MKGAKKGLKKAIEQQAKGKRDTMTWMDHGMFVRSERLVYLNVKNKKYPPTGLVDRQGSRDT